MMVANSFDLWQRDTFFSAAEEVQRSADMLVPPCFKDENSGRDSMESAYRTWERQKIEGLKPIYLDELCRELQTALGTAKWQLEEFEKAVAQSYRCHEDDLRIRRHIQFVDAIKNQISRVETSLEQSFNEQGKTPLRWVNLDEEESDDLAAFLSGTKQSVRKICIDRGVPTNPSPEKNYCIKMERSNSTKADSKREISYHVKASDFVETRESVDSEVDRTSGSRTTWSSSNKGEWKIVIDPEEDQNNALAPNIEVTPKDKGPKPVFWRQRSRDWIEANAAILSFSQLRGIRRINQILGRCGGCQRQLQAPSHLNLSSVKFKLLLMLTLFLIVPFLMYSA